MTTQISTLPIANQVKHVIPYSLKWRQDKLLVRRNHSGKQLYLPALENQDKLIECLKNSPVKLVSIEPGLGETEVRFWADACAKAGQKVFIKIPAKFDWSKKRHPLEWYLKSIRDRLVAVILLLVLSPLMLGLSLWLAMSDSGPIFFQQWRVGQRGRLFRIFKFRTMVVNAENLHHQVMNYLPNLYHQENDPRLTPLGRILRQCNLDELPQLINVLRGEMSLVGPRPSTIYDAVALSLEGQRQLNNKPGMVEVWQNPAEISVVDLSGVSQNSGI